jgi:hypothetical protein
VLLLRFFNARLRVSIGASCYVIPSKDLSACANMGKLIGVDIWKQKLDGPSLVTLLYYPFAKNCQLIQMQIEFTLRNLVVSF